MHNNNSKLLVGCLFGGIVASVGLALNSSTQADTKLLPFQGRLTDAAGSALDDGARVVEFKMYDAPTGGKATWAGEVHKLSINGGLVNTMLGSKASLSKVDFAEATYLQITVDANGDGSITAADPPLLPRQSVIGSVYAVESGNARKLDDHPAAEYEAIFDQSDPATGLVNGAKLKPASVSGAAVADSSITSSHLANGTIGAADLASSAVTSTSIADGTIQTADLSTGLQQGVTPVGSISAYILDTPPPGWLLCRGDEILVADYPALAAAIVTKFGQSSAPGTKVKLPDLRGMFLRGRNDGRSDSLADPNAGDTTNNGADGKRFATWGGAMGDRVGSAQNDNFKSHQHTMSKALYDAGGGGTMANGNYWGISIPGLFGAPHAESAPTGGSETRPKNINVNYIIKS